MRVLRRSIVASIVLSLLSISFAGASHAAEGAYAAHNLVSDGSVPAEYRHSHADVHASALLASGIDPLASGNFIASDLSAVVNDGDVIGNLREKILGI